MIERRVAEPWKLTRLTKIANPQWRVGNNGDGNGNGNGDGGNGDENPHRNVGGLMPVA
ncbi:hypothetical protein Tco_0347055, partial [Tanacetum coccineum]